MAIKSVDEMIAAARAEIDNHSPTEAKRRVDEEGALLVDIRDVRELQRDGVIPGAMHAPRGMLEFWIDPASPYHKDFFASGNRFVFFCAGGWRSALAAKTAQDMGLTPVAHLHGGFGAWKKSGAPVAAVEPKPVR